MPWDGENLLGYLKALEMLANLILAYSVASFWYLVVRSGPGSVAVIIAHNGATLKRKGRVRVRVRVRVKSVATQRVCTCVTKLKQRVLMKEVRRLELCIATRLSRQLPPRGSTSQTNFCPVVTSLWSSDR